MSHEAVVEKLSNLTGWEVQEGKKLKKEFKRKNFLQGKHLIDLIALIAQEQGHHPSLTLTYTKLEVTLTTHAAGGLTGNDFIMAAFIDELAAGDEGVSL